MERSLSQTKALFLGALVTNWKVRHDRDESVGFGVWDGTVYVEWVLYCVGCRTGFMTR